MLIKHRWWIKLSLVTVVLLYYIFCSKWVSTLVAKKCYIYKPFELNFESQWYFSGLYVNIRFILRLLKGIVSETNQFKILIKKQGQNCLFSIVNRTIASIKPTLIMIETFTDATIYHRYQYYHYKWVFNWFKEIK